MNFQKFFAEYLNCISCFSKVYSCNLKLCWKHFQHALYLKLYWNFHNTTEIFHCMNPFISLDTPISPWKASRFQWTKFWYLHTSSLLNGIHFVNSFSRYKERSWSKHIGFVNRISTLLVKTINQWIVAFCNILEPGDAWPWETNFLSLENQSFENVRFFSTRTF